MGELTWSILFKWLEEAGIPVTISSLLALFLWVIDRRQTAREVASLAEENRLSQDEGSFRTHMLTEVSNLREHIRTLYSELSSCRKQHEECAREMAILRAQISQKKED